MLLSVQDIVDANLPVNASPAPVDVTSTVLSNASPGMLSTYVPEHVLDPSSQYRFTVEVRLRWARGVVPAQSSVDIITAACPAGGEVTVSPSHGIAGLTRWAQGDSSKALIAR
jgi:hypothetical protein